MQALVHNVQTYDLQTRGATRGSGRPWWRNILPSSNEMTYECDTGLGKPTDVDCSRIEWHQLKSNIPSDTLAVGPQNPTLLHSSKNVEHMQFAYANNTARNMQPYYHCRCNYCTQVGANPDSISHAEDSLRSNPSTCTVRGQGLL